MVLCGLQAKVLVYARQLFHAVVKQHKVMHQLQQALLVAQLAQILVQLVAAVVGLVFLPGQKVFGRRANGAVLQPFGIIARQNQLHGAEKPLVKLRLLVGEVLAHPIANAHAAVFQLQHAHGNAVHIQHHVRPALQRIAFFQRHLLHHGKVVFFGLLPVNQAHRGHGLARLGFHLHAIAQQAIHRLVVGIQRAVWVAGFFVQLVQRRADLGGAIARLGQIGREQASFDVAVAAPLAPVAQVVVTQVVLEQLQHARLGGAFGLGDVVHNCLLPYLGTAC